MLWLTQTEKNEQLAKDKLDKIEYTLLDSNSDGECIATAELEEIEIAEIIE